MSSEIRVLAGTSAMTMDESPMTITTSASGRQTLPSPFAWLTTTQAHFLISKLKLHWNQKGGLNQSQPTFPFIRYARALEDELQGVLNLAVTQVAQEWCIPKRSFLERRPLDHSVHDLPAHALEGDGISCARSCEAKVRVAIGTGA